MREDCTQPAASDDGPLTDKGEDVGEDEDSDPLITIPTQAPVEQFTFAFKITFSNVEGNFQPDVIKRAICLSALKSVGLDSTSTECDFKLVLGSERRVLLGETMVAIVTLTARGGDAKKLEGISDEVNKGSFDTQQLTEGFTNDLRTIPGFENVAIELDSISPPTPAPTREKCTVLTFYAEGAQIDQRLNGVYEKHSSAGNIEWWIAQYTTPVETDMLTHSDGAKLKYDDTISKWVLRSSSLVPEVRFEYDQLNQDPMRPPTNVSSNNASSTWTQYDTDNQPFSAEVTIVCKDTRFPTNQPTHSPTLSPVELCTVLTFYADGFQSDNRLNGIYEQQPSTGSPEWWKTQYTLPKPFPVGDGQVAMQGHSHEGKLYYDSEQMKWILSSTFLTFRFDESNQDPRRPPTKFDPVTGLNQQSSWKQFTIKDGELQDTSEVSVQVQISCKATRYPTGSPTKSPIPTWVPTSVPTDAPITNYPTQLPSLDPTEIPILDPTVMPTLDPIVTSDPTKTPTLDPTGVPTVDSRTLDPTVMPTLDPIETSDPTKTPTLDPTGVPTVDSTTLDLTVMPTLDPIETSHPTKTPTLDPIGVPTVDPTEVPSLHPTGSPTTETFRRTFKIVLSNIKSDSFGFDDSEDTVDPHLSRTPTYVGQRGSRKFFHPHLNRTPT